MRRGGRWTYTPFYDLLRFAHYSVIMLSWEKSGLKIFALSENVLRLRWNLSDDYFLWWLIYGCSKGWNTFQSWTQKWPRKIEPIMFEKTSKMSKIDITCWLCSRVFHTNHKSGPKPMATFYGIPHAELLTNFASINYMTARKLPYDGVLEHPQTC